MRLGMTLLGLSAVLVPLFLLSITATTRLMRKLVLALVLSLAAPMSVLAQSVTLDVCNMGMIDIDVFVLQDGPTAPSSNIKPSTCGSVATDKEGIEAYLGFAFVNSRGQWGAPRRFDNVPNLGVRELPPASILALTLKGQPIPPTPRILSAAVKSATVRHGNTFATLPMQLFFRPAFPLCKLVWTGDPFDRRKVKICENLVYTLMVEAHGDSHEASLGRLPIRGDFDDGPQSEGKSQVNWADVAAERKQRETLEPMNWNDLVPALEKSKIVTGTSDTGGLVHPYSMPRFIKVRGTVSAVELRQYTASDNTTKVTVAEINFRESPLAPGTRHPEFNVCTTRLDVLEEVFGADFRTSLIGKTIEVEGKPQGSCWGELGKIELFLSRQVRPVESGQSSTGTRASPPPREAATPAGLQSVAGYQPSWIGQKMVVIGTVSRFDLRDVKGEPYVYLYFKERPDSTVVACTRDASWLLGLLGVKDFQSVVGTTLQFEGEVVNGTCTPHGAGLWIYQRGQVRIVGGPSQ